MRTIVSWSHTGHQAGQARGSVTIRHGSRKTSNVSPPTLHCSTRDIMALESRPAGMPSPPRRVNLRPTQVHAI